MMETKSTKSDELLPQEGSDKRGRGGPVARPPRAKSQDLVQAGRGRQDRARRTAAPWRPRQEAPVPRIWENQCHDKDWKVWGRVKRRPWAWKRERETERATANEVSLPGLLH